jgi:hypothetical protein
MECSSDLLRSQSIGAITKNYLQELRSGKILFDKLEYFIIWHLSGPAGAELIEFYCNLFCSLIMYVLFKYTYLLCFPLQQMAEMTLKYRNPYP